MREQEQRGINPNSYTTPASVFNVLAVEIDEKATENKSIQELPLKTLQMPAMDLLKLDPIADPLESSADQFEGTLKRSTCKSVDAHIDPPTNQASKDPSYPSLIQTNTNTNNDSQYLIMNSNFSLTSSSNLPPPYQAPPSKDTSKSRSLERNLGQNSISAFRMNSLERKTQANVDYNAKGAAQRSQSLIRQYSNNYQPPNVEKVTSPTVRSASLERQLPLSFKPYTMDKTQALQYQQQQQINLRNNVKGGSLERSQAIIMNDMMRKYYDKSSEFQKMSTSSTQKINRSASLERNTHFLHFNNIMVQKQLQQQQSQQNEILEENIYDFGGVHVKSCATIALKKSIERGALPPNTVIAATPQSPQLSFDGNPDHRHVLKHAPQPSIASRMAVFQQQQMQQQFKIQNPSPIPPSSPKLFCQSPESILAQVRLFIDWSYFSDFNDVDLNDLWSHYFYNTYILYISCCSL